MYADRSHLTNGRFLMNLDNWTATDATYSAGDGDEQYGVAVLAAGGYITQDFTVPYARTYTLQVAVKPVGDTLATDDLQAVITDDDSGTVVAVSLEGDTADTWQVNTDLLGLAPGNTYTLKLLNNAAIPVRIDDVWLWFVPQTRAQIAAQVHARLGQLATDYSLSTTASGALTEGSYTYAIDAALRSMGALNTETAEPDVRYLDPNDIATVIDLVESEMLKRVQRSAVTETDVSLGPRRESRSQKSKAIGELVSGSGGGGASRVVMRPLRRETKDYDFS
jgi:hypothetical protein